MNRSSPCGVRDRPSSGASVMSAASSSTCSESSCSSAGGIRDEDDGGDIDEDDGMLRITVGALTGRCIQLALPQGATVEDAHTAVSQTLRTSVDSQVLVFRNVKLDESSRSLQSYGICSGCTLQLVMQMKGGPGHVGFWDAGAGGGVFLPSAGSDSVSSGTCSSAGSLGFSDSGSCFTASSSATSSRRGSLPLLPRGSQKGSGKLRGRKSAGTSQDGSDVLLLLCKQGGQVYLVEVHTKEGVTVRSQVYELGDVNLDDLGIETAVGDESSELLDLLQASLSDSSYNGSCSSGYSSAVSSASASRAQSSSSRAVSELCVRRPLTISRPLSRSDAEFLESEWLGDILTPSPDASSGGGASGRAAVKFRGLPSAGLRRPIQLPTLVSGPGGRPRPATAINVQRERQGTTGGRSLLEMISAAEVSARPRSAHVLKGSSGGVGSRQRRSSSSLMSLTSGKPVDGVGGAFGRPLSAKDGASVKAKTSSADRPKKKVSFSDLLEVRCTDDPTIEERWMTCSSAFSHSDVDSVDDRYREAMSRLSVYDRTKSRASSVKSLRGASSGENGDECEQKLKSTLPPATSPSTHSLRLPPSVLTSPSTPTATTNTTTTTSAGLTEEPQRNRSSRSRASNKSGGSSRSRSASRKAKKLRHKCAVCNKRLSLALTFQCRCSSTKRFCPEHRYSDRHDCSFDFRALGGPSATDRIAGDKGLAEF